MYVWVGVFYTIYHKSQYDTGTKSEFKHPRVIPELDALGISALCRERNVSEILVLHLIVNI